MAIPLRVCIYTFIRAPMGSGAHLSAINLVFFFFRGGLWGLVFFLVAGVSTALWVPRRGGVRRSNKLQPSAMETLFVAP